MLGTLSAPVAEAMPSARRTIPAPIAMLPHGYVDRFHIDTSACIAGGLVSGKREGAYQRLAANTHCFGRLARHATARICVVGIPACPDETPRVHVHACPLELVVRWVLKKGLWVAVSKKAEREGFAAGRKRRRRASRGLVAVACAGSGRERESLEVKPATSSQASQWSTFDRRARQRGQKAKHRCSALPVALPPADGG